MTNSVKKGAGRMRRSINCGFSLVELTVTLSVLLVLSWAIFKGVRIGNSVIAQSIALSQAKALANRLAVDAELAPLIQGANRLQQVWGFLYTRSWPLAVNSVFGPADFIEVEAALQMADDRGCAVGELVFRPCIDTVNGLWVELVHNQVVIQVYPGYVTKNTSMVSLSIDAKLYQRFYFGQTGVYQGSSLAGFYDRSDRDTDTISETANDE